jgi:hypothetical protein
MVQGMETNHHSNNGNTMLTVIVDDTTNSLAYFAQNADGGLGFDSLEEVADLADANENNPNVYFHAVELPEGFRFAGRSRWGDVTADIHAVKRATGATGRTWEAIALRSY